MATMRLDHNATALLVVDMQQRLMAVMHEPKRAAERASRLIQGFGAMGLFTMATEQYPKGLGPTVAEVSESLGQSVAVYEKLKFSASIEPVRAAFETRGVRSVLVAGIEAHICVAQTCLDLLDAGYVVAVAWDAVTSRRAMDYEVAKDRLTQAGVLAMTVESALMELAHEAGGERFKAIREIIK